MMHSLRNLAVMCGSLALMAGGLIGCGGSRDAMNNNIVWPPAPDEPRVRYVATYRGEKDFQSGFQSLTEKLAGSSGAVKLSAPFDICTDNRGRFWVTDVASGVFQFDTVKREVKVLGEKSTLSLSSPRGIAYGDNKLFISVHDYGQLAVLSADDGSLLYTIGPRGHFQSAVDVCYDSLTHHVLVVDNKLHHIEVYSESGDSLFTFGKRGTGDGEMNYPQSITTDDSSHIYLVDAFNFRVEIFDAQGHYLRQFGKQGNVYGTFFRPKGIALDSYRNIYVLDANHQNFQIFNNAGELLMFVGKFSGGNDGFQNPVGICIDATNRIYVTDQLNSRVQVFQLLKGN